MPLESSALGVLIIKYGWIKLLTVGAALFGAGLMCMFRPPKTKKELFYQGAVALGCSMMFGDVFSQMFDFWFDFIDLKVAPKEQVIQFIVAVHGLVGAMSWGVFGGMAVLRDKFGTDPVGTVKDIKNV